MEHIRVAGPLICELVPGGEEGDRNVVVSPMPHKRVEIPMGKVLAAHLAECLTCSDEELQAKLTAESEAAEAMQKIHLPNGVQPN